MEGRGPCWELSRLLQPKWAGQTPSSPLLLLHLVGPLPPASPDLPGLPPMPPSTHAAWRGLCRGHTGLGAQQAPWPKWTRQSPSVPLPLLPEGPSRLPLLTSPASGLPILSGLYFSSPLSPPSPTGSLRGSSCLLGHQGPPPAAGRRPSCGKTLTPCLPTRPSLSIDLLQRCQDHLMRKEYFFQQMVLGQLDIHIKIKFDFYLIPYTKVNSNHIIDLHVRTKTPRSKLRSKYSLP